MIIFWAKITFFNRDLIALCRYRATMMLSGRCEISSKLFRPSLVFNFGDDLDVSPPYAFRMLGGFRRRQNAYG